MADDHGRGGELNGVPADGLAAVAHVDDHVQLVEPLDDGAPEVGDTAGVVLRTAVADEVAKVVGKLDLAQAEVVEEVDSINVGAERDGVLEVDDDPVLALAVDPLDVVRVQDEGDLAAEHVDHGARLGDALDGRLKGHFYAASRDIGARSDCHAGRLPQADIVLDGLGVGLHLAGGHAGHAVAGDAPVNSSLMEIGEGGPHVVIEEESARGGRLLRVDDEGLVVQLAGLGRCKRRWTDGISDGWHGRSFGNVLRDDTKPGGRLLHGHSRSAMFATAYRLLATAIVHHELGRSVS